MAMALKLFLVLLGVMVSIPASADDVVSGESYPIAKRDQLPVGDARATGANSTRVLFSAWYPDSTIGPSSWEYFRVDISPRFSVLSISFTKRRWTSQGKGPLVCFRFGGLPLPSAPVESLELALNVAGNFSIPGMCAVLKETTYLNVSNEEVISGLLYIGMFSDTSPSRTQSKMISRGATYKFGMQLSVTACERNFVGRYCNGTATSIPFTNDLYLPGENETTDMRHGGIQALDSPGNSSWNTLSDNCVDGGAWTFFLLEITDMVAALEIVVDHDASVADISCLAKHSALPKMTDALREKSSGKLIVHTPKRGPWYIGVSVFNSTGPKACFSLRWRIQTCLSGYAGTDCMWPSILLERILSSKPSESPFDSRFVPLDHPLESSWFAWDISNTDNIDSVNRWLYFVLEVPKGAAGSVLSFQLHFSGMKSLEAYARSEGYPTLNNWDFHFTSEDNKVLSFDIIYPMEGIWSVGLFYSLETEAFLKLHVTLHGCSKSCSHFGSCATSYEASRLTFFSFCNCDRTHGGIDCSETLLSPSEKSLQILFLVGSNAAALLPSFWALRQKAISEWLVYTTSGISSAIYHSCDAGGWCAMSYDTLQFLDFWLSFLAVIFTCLYLAEVLGLMKSTFHIGAAIITAIIAKNNRTSGRSALIVIGISALGLLFGLGLDMWRQKQVQRWQMIRRWSMLHNFEEHASNFIKKLRSRFIWAYVGIGVTIVGFAGLCWKLEKAKTYWIWHSLWHVSIFTGAFFLLFSVVEAPSDEQDIAQASSNNELETMSNENTQETTTFIQEHS